jgi:hypothetical protein
MWTELDRPAICIFCLFEHLIARTLRGREIIVVSGRSNGSLEFSPPPDSFPFPRITSLNRNGRKTTCCQTTGLLAGFAAFFSP